MKLNIASNYEEMSRQAAKDLLRIIQPLKRPLICPASGSSPAGLYQQVVQEVMDNRVDTSDWVFVALDEWKGMNGADEGSCRHYLDKQLFQPLQVNNDNICFFDGRATNLQMECERAEAFVALHGGIDVAIVGIGINGHIGMNEPGTPAVSRTHIAAIHPLTQQVGQKYFSQPRQLDGGITLGMATIREATHIFLLANGAHKAEIVRRMLQEEISEQLPATLLREHPNLHIYLDSEAAGLLA